MAPSSLPSLTELTEGMKDLGRTEKWDVVVSYSLTELNAVLQKLWKSDSATQKAHFSVEREGPGHSKYWTDFDITLAAPTLSFTPSKSASLKMNLSGKYHDYTEDKTYPDDTIPTGYYFEANLPIICVSVDQDKIGKSTGMGGILDFDTSKPDEKLHVVFSFDSTKDPSAVFDIKRQADADQKDTTFVGTAPYLTKWIKDHWKTIKYSLAAIAPTPVDGARFLTPQHVAFTVYTTSDSSKGCLSLYIRTKDSGYADGYATPVFHLTNGDSIPIPSDHTASIIIRRELVQQFLTKTIKDAEAHGEKALDVEQTSTTTGFRYTNKLNAGFQKSFKEVHTALGDYNIRTIDWSFDKSPLDVNIVNNQSHWTMSFKSNFEWGRTRTYVSHGEVKSDNKYGEVEYKLRMDHSATVLSLDEEKVTAKLEVQGGWWQREAKAVEPSDWEKVNGKQDYIPGVVQDWINGWQFPTFSNTMRLDFFATTNVFAPGKHIIDIDTNIGVFTPHDLLIVGNVVDPSELDSKKEKKDSSEGDTEGAGYGRPGRKTHPPPRIGY
ncbi:hypothetical protein ABW21_db0201074 [Orbilia brochopaga]|nr:hypothetical protein ABW21_db0201074 [Drechslerella brochopaga]